MCLLIPHVLSTSYFNFNTFVQYHYNILPAYLYAGPFAAQDRIQDAGLGSGILVSVSNELSFESS